jgi:nucleoside-diphosphate-sugar epimerase
VAVKRALVCGGSGFLGTHLSQALKRDGYWVRAVDVRPPSLAPGSADEFMQVDLRTAAGCRRAVRSPTFQFDEVFQLAADMGGMGFLSTAECEVLTNNALININMIRAAIEAGVRRYFFSSSACVYRDMRVDEAALDESGAYPAFPDNEYGWEKLYSERLVLAHARCSPIGVRVARFQNCYGPYATWRGGREKAPAAICRKVAEAPDGGTIEVWGDGCAVRSFVYVDDLVEAVKVIMTSDATGPVNVGTDEHVTIASLVELVAAIAEKRIHVRYVSGPVGVQARYLSHDRIRAMGWRPRVTLADGLRRTYAWVEHQVRAHGQTSLDRQTRTWTT